MATFFKTTRLWVVDYTWDGRARRRYKALAEGADGPTVLAAEVADVLGKRAKIVNIRPATCEEETDYLRDRHARNILCPTGRR